MPRREAPSRSRGLNQLARTLRDVPPEDIASVLRKRAKIDIRVSEQEKLEIQQMAERLGVTVTEYLLKLHKREVRRGKNRDRPCQTAHH